MQWNCVKNPNFSKPLVSVLSAQRSCIKLFSTLRNIPDFFESSIVFSLYSAFFFFSNHGKHEEFSLCNLPRAILRAGDCLHFLKENLMYHPSETYTWSPFCLTDFEWSSWRCCYYDEAWNISSRTSKIFPPTTRISWVVWPLMWRICTFLFITRTRLPPCYNILG